MHSLLLCFKLYGRDDVWAALRGQKQALGRIRSGWLPLTPQGRGGQLPIVQLPLLPAPCPVPEALQSICFPLHTGTAFGEDAGALPSSPVKVLVSPTVAPSAKEHQSEELLSSSEEESAQSLGAPDEVLFLQAQSGVLHMASLAPAGTGVLCDGAAGAGSTDACTWVKPACGMLSKQLHLLQSLPASPRFCRHKACQLVLHACQH